MEFEEKPVALRIAMDEARKEHLFESDSLPD